MKKKRNSQATPALWFAWADNLIHDNIYNEALKLGGGEKYDFTQAYEHVTKYIEGTDVAIINQETLVTDSVEPQSYPMFASPTAVGDQNS